MMHDEKKIYCLLFSELNLCIIGEYYLEEKASSSLNVKLLLFRPNFHFANLLRNTDFAGSS